MDHNTVIFQKEKRVDGGGVHIKITGMQDSNSLKVDRNKNVTLNRCP